MTANTPRDSRLESAYNVGALRPDAQQIRESWIERSASFRTGADARIDCAYGSHPREKIDVYRCGEPNAPLLVFIHGGYWQRGDKSMCGLVAEPFVNSGVDMALIGYPLCPEVRMTGLVDSVRRAIVWLYKNAREFGVNADRLNVCGHSAGGHLTAMMMATDWPAVDQSLPGDLIKSGVPISGLFQLEPLRHTTIGDALNLDDTEITTQSPYFLAPKCNAPILVTLGGAETDQFHWQADEFFERWSGFGADLDYYIEPDADHFDVLSQLGNAESGLFRKIRSLLK